MTGPIDPTGTTEEGGAAGTGAVVGGAEGVVFGGTAVVDGCGDGEWATGVAVHAARPTALTRSPSGQRIRMPLWWSGGISEGKSGPEPGVIRLGTFPPPVLEEF